MTLAGTPEQRELREWVRRLLNDRAPVPTTLAVMETEPAYDVELWRLMGSQLGLQGMLVPERFGGAGSSVSDVVVVLEEMGRAVLPTPFFSSSVLATRVLLAGATEAAQAELLPRLAAAEAIACVVLPGSRGSVSARQHDGQWVLDGHSGLVVFGHAADLTLVVARTAEGSALFAVESGTAGLRCERLPSLDLTRPLAELSFPSVPARRISGPGDVSTAVEAAVDVALVALGAEQVGGARRCLDLTVDYATMRTQFGRPIGSFQAVKHGCADMLSLVEPARSAVLLAAHAADATDPELPALASAVKAHCPQVYLDVAAETIQLHGAIGFSWEHEAHLHLKRAKSGQLLFGDARHHRERLLSSVIEARA